MKKTKSLYKFSLFLFGALVAVIFSHTSYASVANKFVLGTAYDANGNAWKNATVTVTCNASVSGSTTDGTTGAYSAGFSASNCNNNDSVLVEVSKDDVTCSNTGKMGPQDVTVDVRCPLTPSVPEFGLLTGALAAVGGAGSYFLLKRKAN